MTTERNQKLISEFLMPMLTDYLTLIQDIMASNPRETDKRFSDGLWTSNPFYNFISQSHLLLEKHSRNFFASLHSDTLDKKSLNKALYTLEQVMAALSPSNFLLTNPVLIQEMIATNGESVLNGLRKFQNDIANPHRFQIQMTDQQHYEVGKNIAVTPGKVIFQNDIMQLIQYAPQTAKVYERPLLFVPAFINKFYIFDLSPECSLIDWLVKRGFTVFAISWINPDASYSDKDFANYVQEGPEKAIEIIKNKLQVKDVNIAGYCIGGTIVAYLLAYLSAKKDTSIKSVTYLNTMLDFTDFGIFSDLVDEDLVSQINELMLKQGYLDGYFLHQLFNFLRPNDLVWPYYIQNYLQGITPSPNDMLHWNADYTNIPPKVINYCLHQFCLQNRLIKPNHLTMNEVPINLNSIQVPAYFFSTIRDHLTPWKSTYSGLSYHSGKSIFILGDSGHIAGVVNPPSSKKYGYYINSKYHTSPDQFLENATKIAGSWWPHWQKWLKKYSGKKVPARDPNDGPFTALEDAPGSYAKLKAHSH